MKAPFSVSVVRSAALGLVVAVGISAQSAAAATQQTTTAAVGKKKAAAVAAVPTGNEVGMLDEAYGLLRRADHDYHGHRARAMHKIEDAAKALGAKLSGGGKGDEKQGTSDSQVRSAQSLLERAVGGLAGAPHHHIEEAIKQLSIALKLK